MIIRLRTSHFYLCAALLCLLYCSVLGKELTAEQRAIADALVGKQIKEFQANKIKGWELQSNIEKLKKHEIKWQGYAPAVEIGYCAAGCRALHIPIPEEINDTVVDDIIWQYENASGDKNDIKYYKEACACALGNIGNKKGVPTILKSLERESGHTSWNGLEGIADESLIPAIEKYLDFDSQQDSLSAIKCLTSIGPKSIPTLHRFLKGRDNTLKREAINAIIKICDIQCIPVLEEVIAWNNPEFTEKAKAGILLISCRASDKIYSPPKLSPEDESRVYYLTILVFSDITDPNLRNEATKTMLKLGESSIWNLRLTLSSTGHEESPYLIFPASERARDILTKIGEPAIPALIDALCDEQQHCRNFAAQALQKITGETFGADYEKWKSWYFQKYRTKNIPKNIADANAI